MTSGGIEDDQNRSVVTEHQHHQPPPPYQGVSNYPPPPQQQSPAIAYPKPAQQQSPAIAYPKPAQQQSPATAYPQPVQPYVAGYAVPGEGPTTGHHRLPCCGIGIGWLLFILGFLFTIPWYIGFFLLLFSRNPREKGGYIACSIAALFATIIIVIQVIRIEMIKSQGLK